MKMRQFFSAVIFLFIVLGVNCQTNNVRLSNAITPSLYTLAMTVEVDFYSFNGTVTIDFTTTRGISEIEMHSKGLTIVGSYATIKSSSIETNSTYILAWNETEKITIGLGRTLPARTNHSITLSFRGRIANDMKGLYMSSYYDGDVKYIATTFSAAAYARRIFPCFDEPALKARFRLKIECRSNMMALANTRIVNEEFWNDKFGTWRVTEFEETVPMSTYLLAFTVSDFVNITSFDEPVFSVYASSKEYLNMEFALNVGRNALEALEEYTGHPYQLSKMDFIAIDDFLYGAMENWGFISYKTSRIVNPVGQRNRRNVQEIISIISHEIVHQHFGNQVTCEYWQYVWLNEGFASYLEYIIADKIHPSFRILDQFVSEDMHPVMARDVKPKTHAMTRPVTTIDEIAKIYDFVAYPKAASVIRMIEQIMTPAVFKKGLNLYLEERKFNSATEEQLFSVLQRSRPDANSNETLYPPIPEIFRSWSLTPGYPILNVNYIRDESVIKISQEQFSPLINETEPSAFFILYNYVESQRSETEYWLINNTKWQWINNITKEREHTEVAAKWVIFNLQQTGYYRVNYNVDNWNAIIDDLNSNTFHIIHVLNRAQLLDDSFNLAKSGYLDFSIALDILKYMHREYELMPLTDGFRTIEYLLTRLDEEPFYNDLLVIMRNILDEIYIRVNNASHPEYPHVLPNDYHQMVKLKVNLFACKFGAPACITDARSQMILSDLMILRPTADERQYLYCGALQADLADAHWNQLKLRLASITNGVEMYRDNQDEISDILYALSNCDDDRERVELLLTDIFNKSQPFPYNLITVEDAAIVVGNLIRGYSKRREVVMDFYRLQFEMVNSTVPLTSVLSIFAEAINTETHLDRLKELASEVNVDVGESVREIEKNLHWMEEKVPEISAWVKNERGGVDKLKFSLMTIIFSIFVIVLQ